MAEMTSSRKVAPVDQGMQRDDGMKKLGKAAEFVGKTFAIRPIVDGTPTIVKEQVRHA
jgi:hypothetical protein